MTGDTKPPSVPPPAFLAAEMRLAIGELGCFHGQWDARESRVRFRAKWDRESERGQWSAVHVTGWHDSIDDVFREVIETCRRLDGPTPEPARMVGAERNGNG